MPPAPTGRLRPLKGEALGPAAEGDGAQAPEVLERKAAKPVRAPGPTLPSPEEIAIHYVSHIPYRAWCSQRGRGKSFAHDRVDRPDNANVRRSRLFP